jgi:hypothetical protein
MGGYIFKKGHIFGETDNLLFGEMFQYIDVADILGRYLEMAIHVGDK